MADQSWLDPTGRFLQSAGSGAWEGAKSVGQGVVDLGKGGYALATDGAARERAWNAANQASQAAMNYGSQAIADPAKAFNDAAAGANSLWTAFDDARKAAEASGQGPEFWGNIAGRGGFEVGAALIPVGALAKAGKLPGLVKGADAASDLARASKLPVSCKACHNKKSPRRPSAALIAARKQTAVDFFRNKLGMDATEASDALKGVDLNYPVEIVDIPPPDTMAQYVRKSNGRPGNWFSPDVNATGDALGLNTDPAVRELAIFRTPPGQALKSTAAPIVDDWTDSLNPVSTKGGGVQITVPNALKSQFVKVGP